MKKIIIYIFLCVNCLYSKELTPISLQLTWMYQFQFAGYIMAKEKGFYSQKGLDVTLKEYKANNAPIYEVRDGKAQFGISRSDLIIHRLNGMANYLQLFALCQASPLELNTIEKRGIKELSDLKGKKILYFDTPELFASVYGMLETNGIKSDDYTWVKAKGYDLEEIMDGRADIVAGYSTITPNIFKNKGFNPVSFHPKDYGFDFYGDILFTTDEYAKENPLIVKNFYEASLKGWEYAFTNVDETIDVIKEKYNTQNLKRELLEYEADAFKELAFFPGIPFGDINPVKLEKIANTFKLLGKTESTKTDFTDFIYTSKDKNSYLTKKEKAYIKDNPVIKVGVKKDLVPVDFINKLGLHSGVANDILKFVSQNTGLRFIYIQDTESIQKLEKKELDLIITTQELNNKNFLSTKTIFNLKEEKFIKDITQDDNSIKQIKTQNTPISFTLHKDNQVLKSILLKTIEKLTVEQRKAIHNKWVPKVIKESFDWTIIWQILTLAALIIILLLYKNIQRKKSEKIRLSKQVDEKTKDLQIALEDKALLLKELNHRVKNNMQMIISLLRLQEDNIKDEKLKSILLTIQNRINAMSHFHELLYTQNNTTHIHADDYIELLISDLKSGFESNIDIEYDIKVDLDISQAIYVGIILNELITNAIKYAYDDDSGLIFIELKREKNIYYLRVKDNGKGFPKESSKNSLGMTLIKLLVQKQLKGSVVFNSDNGVEVNIQWSNNK